MYKVETKQKGDFNGFGQGALAEYFYSQNMKASLNGLATKWNASKKSDNDQSAELVNMDIITWMDRGILNNDDDYLFGMDANGRIYGSKQGLFSYEYIYHPTTDTGQLLFNGMIVDQKMRLVYASSRYIGVNESLVEDYTTGTITLTNGANTVVGAGTTFTSDMTGKRIKANGEGKFYTFTFVDATHGTLNTNYTGVTGAGKSYKIFTQWTDQKWDLGAEYNYEKQICLYQDYIIVPHKNKIAIISSIDDSISLDAFTLPEEFVIKSCKPGKNGVLIGANFKGRGMLILWDAFSDRSISDWIYLNEPIVSIIEHDDGNWIAISSKRPYYTDGYSAKKILVNAIDDVFQRNSIFSSVPTQGAIVNANKLIFHGGQGEINRGLKGLYIMDLNTGLFEFVTYSNGSLYGPTPGAIYLEPSFQRIHFSYKDGSISIIDNLSESAPAGRAVYIDIFGQGEGSKVAEMVKLKLGIDNKYYTSGGDFSFTVKAKIAPIEKPLWKYAQQQDTTTDLNKIYVNGGQSSYNNATVGDMIWVLDGASAGEMRHITAIDNADTADEVWTLDEDLPVALELYGYVAVMPFREIGTFEYTNIEHLRDAFFNAQSKVVGKKFYVMIVFEDLEIPIEIQQVMMAYNDLGIN